MTESRNIEKPSGLLFYTEGIRAFAEFLASLFYRLFQARKKKGDGHPVLVIPGFLASKTATKPLRSFIMQNGYQAYDWAQGRNLADFDELGLLSERLKYLYNEHGEKVSVIGWSLGGLYAREVAKQHPDMVRQVITMGAPFNGATEPNNAKWLMNWVKEQEVEEAVSDSLLANLPKPAPVPTTAIYTRQDGIVPWQVCMEQQEDETHQNIRVRGSHMGLAWNISVFRIIADRLQYGRDNWKRLGIGNF